MNIPWVSIGLISDIIGIAILYFNGPPISEIFPDGSEMLVIRPDESDKEKGKQAQRKITYSKIALGFIIIGFILQFIGSVVS